MTKRELVNAMENLDENEEILISSVRCIHDQYKMPDLIPIDFVGDQFINIHTNY